MVTPLGLFVWSGSTADNLSILLFTYHQILSCGALRVGHYPKLALGPTKSTKVFQIDY